MAPPQPPNPEPELTIVPLPLEEAEYARIVESDPTGDDSVGDYIQRTHDQQSPTRAGFTADGAGVVTDAWFVKSDRVVEAITDILGDVAPKGDGSLTRIPPKAHPQYPWLVASAIETIAGLGQGEFEGGPPGARVKAPTGLAVPPIDPTFWQYSVYAFQIKFTAREYDLLPDSSVTMRSLGVVDDQGAPYTARWPEGEWLRWTDWDEAPAAEVMTARQGQAYFVVTTDPISKGPSVTAPPPHGVGFDGFPQIPLNKSLIRFNWHRVPHSYVTSPRSFIKKAIGKINLLDWYNWESGSLLLKAVSVRPYLPPVPALDPATGAYSTARLCDITFLFERVDRPQSAVPPLGSLGGNVVAKHHNLLPWFGDRQFHLAVYPGVPAVLVTGSIQSASGTIVTLASQAALSGVTDAYKGGTIAITEDGGLGQAGQSRTILGSSGTKIAVNTAFDPQPDGSCFYRITGSPALASDNPAQWKPLLAGAVFQELFMDPDAP